MRTCPSSSTGKTPAEAVGRMFRTHLTQLQPALEPSKHTSGFSSLFKVGELAWMMKHSVCKSTWLPGVVCGHSGARAYNIKLNNGAIAEHISGDDVCRRFAPELAEHVLHGTTAQHMPSSQLLQANRQESLRVQLRVTILFLCW
ncbi:hypothetical protein PR048_010931 [Dryococelus australis]|uniref:Uncharacterized protein n=1 Tax=Dryococelus australis TaxID=614101 RepID=A0ABQ9HKD9_9NEOP|nr:hypothetical protein PR048_010931 [Dryococelus australis]